MSGAPPAKRAKVSASAAPTYWLVKMPPFVAADFSRRMEAYADAVAVARRRGEAEPAVPVLGRMRVYGGEREGSAFEAELITEVARRSGGGAVEHVLPAEVKKDTATQVVFAENNACRLEGAPALVVEAKVRPGSAYRAVARDRLKARHTAKEAATMVMSAESQQAARAAKGLTSEVVEQRVRGRKRTAADAEAEASAGVRSSFLAAAAGGRRRPQRVQREERQMRVRDDRADVERMLLGLFEKKEAYRLVELEQLTNQTREYLKQVLADLCDHHKSGELTHHYTLKEEFRM